MSQQYKSAVMLIGFSFMIPVLNWIFGMVVGIQILGALLSRGKYLRIICCLPLAFLWFIGSLYWLAAINKSLIGGALLLALLFGSTVALFHYAEKP